MLYMEEIWVDIKGYEGKYQVSNMGQVKSLNYNNTSEQRILKPKINRYGYSEVRLSKNNKCKNFLISTLVGKHFLKCNDDMYIMHKKDIEDNSVWNLKSGYKSEYLHLEYKRKRRKGKASKNKLSYNGKQYKSLTELARKNNIDKNVLLNRIFNGWTLEEAVELPQQKKNEKGRMIFKVKLYIYNGKPYSIKQLSQLSGIKQGTIISRIRMGWSIEETMQVPVSKRKKVK